MNNFAQSGNQRVLVYPAKTPKVSGKQVYFLFALGQIEDIIRELKVFPLPFSPSYILGLAQWRDQVLPVISLEKCLKLPQGNFISDTNDKIGIKKDHALRPVRLILIRSDNRNIRGLLSVDSAIRLIPRPDSCPALSPGSWLSQKKLVKGVYEWDEGFLLVVNINDILNGEINIKGGGLWNV